MPSASRAERGRAERGRAERGGAEHGSITAEFAIVLPAVVLVLACCLSGMQVAGQQLRLQDAAALAARALARDDSPAAAVARLAPGASLASWADGDLVCARLTAPTSPGVGTILGLTLTASSCALDGGR